MLKNKNDKLSISLLITDGVGYRNFILGRLSELVIPNNITIKILSGLPQSSFTHVTGWVKGASILETPYYLEKKWAATFRRLTELSHSFLHYTVGMQENLKSGYPKGGSPSALYKKGLYLLAYLFRHRLRFFEQCHHWFANRSNLIPFYEDYFKDSNTRLLFVSHQRPHQIIPVVLAAKKLSIPTVAFIFSWDNLTSKGRMPVLFDYYFVWSNLMKEELLRFYPDIKPDHIYVVGTPQFEIYAYPEFGYSKEVFFEKLGLSDDKKTRIICYSCGDQSTSKNDGKYIAMIADAIRGGQVGSSIKLLVRTSPAEEPTRFAELKESYPEVLWNFPQWVQGRVTHPELWSQRYPMRADLDMLKSIASHCDININMCSTITLDFAFFDKPVINVAMGGISPYESWQPDSMFLQFEHFQHIVRSGGTYIAKNREELIQHINDALTNSSEKTIERKKMLDLEISQDLANTSERIMETLLHISCDH